MFALLLIGCGRRDNVDSRLGPKYYSLNPAQPGETYAVDASLDPREAVDEPMSGRTLRGTPVARRTEECYPAEPRDLFWEMDKVAGPDGELKPLDFDQNGDGRISDSERDAIRGRNTWLMWGGGNEAFWGWLQEEGYGLTDFLILLDSRRRGSRFKDAGIINQPGFVASDLPILGLYLDAADGEKAILHPPGVAGSGGDYGVVDTSGYDVAPPERFDSQGRSLERPVVRPSAPPSHPTEPFVPWTTAEKRAAEWASQGGEGEDPVHDFVPENFRAKLPRDGLDPLVYGYPSGVVGLRLWLNPDFFADTPEAATRREYWRERVVKTGDYYYTDARINADPDLVRPLRVSMSCGFCHVGPHPLNPPTDPEHPKWENLSSIIGGQYWDPQANFAALAKRKNFLHHVLKSQAPGTIDTSLVSTDHLNNTNVINAVFDVPARLARAMEKPTEEQSRENLLLPSIEDPETSNNPDGENRQRHFPMVLFPGEDSVGVFGALARVPLNIGVFSEQWARCDNPIIGFTPQRPFSVEISRTNSVFWNVNEKYRVGYMAKFFVHGANGKVPKSTAAMLLKHAGKEGRDALAADEPALRANGREVFLRNCAICHSSKQPDGFDLRFERTMEGGWAKAPVPKRKNRFIYTLPMDFGDWEEFKKSPAYRDYVDQIRVLAGEAPSEGETDGFIEDNFLSNELRIPITLVGTNSARSMATNAMAGNVWDNYSSETFKELKSVGPVRYYNLYSDEPLDQFGNNDFYTDGRTHGGPGYFRPPSLISLWATAPYLHNNALGIYTHDPSVSGRLLAFEDGIRKLLWNEQRVGYERGGFRFVPPGDLRADGSPLARKDPGYIYRLPVDSYVMFAPGFVRPLIEGILVGNLGSLLGHAMFSFVTFWIWVVLVLSCLILSIHARGRHAGLFLLLLAGVLAAALAVTGMGGAGGMLTAALMLGSASLLGYSTLWVWLGVAVVTVLGVVLAMSRGTWKYERVVSRTIFLVLAVVLLFAGTLANKFFNGRMKDVHPALAVLPNAWLDADYKGVRVGPIPRGTPVNLLMNMDPEKRAETVRALVPLFRAVSRIKKDNLTGEAAYEVIAEEAGPALIEASKCPDYVLDRGHWFGEALDDHEKEELIAFLKTL